MQTMSTADAAFLHAETPTAPMHVGAAAIFEGPPPAFDEVVAMLERKLPLLPRYRQRVRFVPNDLGRPVWVDFPHFDLEFHLRRTALPSPGGDKELKELGARVLAHALDREKPLWELWMIEGLADNRWALVSKTHHCMVDGVSGTSLLSTLFDDELTADPEPWAPDREPTDQELITNALAARQFSFAEQTTAWGELMDAANPKTAMTRYAQLLEGQDRLRQATETRARSSLLGAVGPHRRWTWVRYRLKDIKVIRAGLGGTVNDVVLTVIAAGFRALLEARGESTRGRTLKTMVPVSVRRDTESGQMNNRIAAVYPELPLHSPDLVGVLKKVREQMDGIKQSHQAVAADALTSMVGFQPPELIAQASRLAAQLSVTATESVYETVATNVPGPQKPMFALGRQLLEMLPWIPLQSPVRINVPISSYNGGLLFGIVGDYDSSPDIEVLAVGIHAALEQLKEIATSPGSGDGPGPPS
jgi:diacylglycerol O-acyltransferase / wax synthase